MDEARDRARAYVKALPASDRVMLVRADALATPATSFESDRAKLERAIAQSTPGATALNLEQALAFAQHEQALSPYRTGEIVYIGPGRIAAEAGCRRALPKNLRSWRWRILSRTADCARLPCEDPEPIPMCGTSTRRSATTERCPKAVTLALTFGGGPAGARKLNVPAGFRTRGHVRMPHTRRWIAGSDAHAARRFPGGRSRGAGTSGRAGTRTDGVLERARGSTPNRHGRSPRTCDVPAGERISSRQ